MIQKEKDFIRSEVLKLLARNELKHINKPRGGNGESKKHFGIKLVVCKMLSKRGLSYICEARFRGGKRADVLCLDNATVYEVAVSESEDSLERKRRFYDFIGLRMITIRNNVSKRIII